MNRSPSDPLAGPAAPPPRPQIERFFRAMIEQHASDLHVKPGHRPFMRIQTRMLPLGDRALAAEETAAIALEILDARQRQRLDESGSTDVAYEMEGSDRFRINVFRQRGCLALAARRVKRDVPSFRSLHLPPIIARIAEQRQGLVLVSGPTGCGKSTTIAAMIDHINATRECHIVTIEDPIEYLYQSKKSLVSQREIGIDADDFGTALRALLREDPDVVLIGEMRDPDTFAAAIQAAETGHLVFGSVHASSASQAVGRVLDLFEPQTRRQVRQSLSFNLQASICQKLLPALDEQVGRVPAVEVLLRSPSVRRLIEEERDGELPDLIRAGERDGMMTFTRSLATLIQRNWVDPKVAYEYAPNAEELKMMLKGISTSHSGLLNRRISE
jgi:twitching motility protein PilT